MSKVVVATIITTLAAIAPVMAGEVDSCTETLTSPGVLGLVAMGVVGAIAIARSRK